jgi:tetratricopeptide (TPR) repeat protein
MARRLKRAHLALAVAVLTALVGRHADATPAADELVRQARMHESAHEDDLALRRYIEAIALDPSSEEAYLGLGALRRKMGDAREAERVYDTALSHLPSLAAALLERGHARRTLGAAHEADRDLEAYIAATHDVAAMRELAGWYAEESRPLAQLAMWRRLLAEAELSGAVALRKEARVTVRALEILVDTADPVRVVPGEHASAVRRGMWRMERRR